MNNFTKFSATIAILISATTLANATYSNGYYDSLNGKSGSELIAAIKAMANGHKEISYSSGTWNAFKYTDVKRVDGVDYWWDMYSSNLVAISSGHPGLNVEHSVANSWWGGTKNAPYMDIVHLNPSNSDANSRKSNYPLAELSNVTWNNGVTFIGTPKSGQGGGSSYAYEPADEYKGDFARVFMYMFTTYNDISWKSNTSWMYSTTTEGLFKPWAVEMLLRWHANDPVSRKELDRNDGIESQQYNRNPFIDLPGLAEYVWGSKKGQKFYVDGSSDDDPGNNPGGDTPTEETISWLSSTSTSIDAGWEFDNVDMPANLSYVWKWDNNTGNYYLKGSAYVSGTAYAAKAYAWSPEVALTNCTEAKLTFNHAAKFQTTLKTLCKLAVKDLDSNTITDIEIDSWPSAGSWNFTSAGTFNLSQFLGKRIKIGLCYASSAAGADTWEINNMKLALNRTSGIPYVTLGDTDPDNFDDSVLVEVWGNNILAPEGARIYDLNGRVVSGENLRPGIYLVAKESFAKTLKINIK